MRAPDFWDRKSTGLLPTLLRPIGCVAGGLARMRIRSGKPWTAPVPVVCIGNLVAGGAGKTPVAIAVAQHLSALGRKPHIVTRGYGGMELGPVQVDPNHHTYTDVGDEALLLCHAAPTWVAKDRKAGCEAAIDAGADIIVMDDGFQNPSVLKTLSIIVVDGGYGFGNGRVMPAGPLRETVPSGLSRADAVVLLGADEADVWGRIQRLGYKSLSVLRAKLTPVGETQNLKGQEVFAFAGIGRPEKFYSTLQSLGCKIVGCESFDDHHPYRNAEITSILAKAVGNPVYTTRKDYVRLPSDYRDRIHVLDVEVDWKDDRALDGLLATALEQESPHV